MNDLLQGIIQMAAGGGNPMNLVQQFLSQQNQADTRTEQARRLIQGKSLGELQQTAMNLATEAGTTPEQILADLGIPLPRF